MLSIFVCLGGIGLILLAEEFFYRKKILEGEYLRKFVHMSAGTFVAFWPWLIGWRTIQLIGLSMIVVVYLNHRLKKINMSGGVKRITYGGLTFPAAIIISAFLTDEKIFFCLAILNMALADGVAALVGTALHNRSKYGVFHQIKTLAGSAAFWLMSFCILAVGLLFAVDLIPYENYKLLIILLPPVLTVTEAVTIKGFDNISVPVVALIALNLAKY